MGSPVKNDQEMAEQLLGAKKLLKDAGAVIELLARSEAVVQHDTEPLRQKREKLLSRLSEQENFLQKYLATKPEERIALLYN